MTTRLLQVLREQTWTATVRRHLQGLWERYARSTAIGRVRFGSLRRLTPIGRATVVLLKLNAPTRLLHRQMLIAQGRYP